MALVDAALIEAVAALARAAGAEIMHHYGTAPAGRLKADASPVTAADEAADRLILAGLARLTPAVAIVSEETAPASPPDPDSPFWLVDPLDGTKEFLSRNGEFTVNIALIDGGRPVLGFVHIPCTAALYWGGIGLGAHRVHAGHSETVSARVEPRERLAVALSRSHDDAATRAYVATLGAHDVVRRGSALKFCLIAEGGADIYPRFGPTMEWDTAAGHALVEAAGAHVTTVAGDDLRYGKPGHRNPGFIARAPGTAARDGG